MPKGKSSKIVFKTRFRDQNMLLPPHLGDLIPDDDLVRIVDQTLDEIDIQAILDTYHGGGTSIYDPRMLLKVLVYAYLTHIFSGRAIARALRENIKFMWLSGMNKPDFRTLNEFRSKRMLGLMEGIFASVTEILMEKGYISAKALNIDGTKMEADANKNSYVWSKNTERYKAGVKQKVKELFEEIDRINEEEDKKYGDKDLDELTEKDKITSEDIKRQAKKINEQIRQDMAEREKLTKSEKKVKRAAKKLEKNLLPKLEKYEKQESILNGRGSYSKTDHDATFHKMKDGRVLPSYNVLISTENQFIVNYSIHQNPAETHHLIDHLEKLERTTGILPSDLIGDSAFGSQENYTYLEEKSIGNYLKYNTFYRKDKKIKGKYFDKEYFDYTPVGDYFICPYLRKLHYKETVKGKTKHGYPTEAKKYECDSCEGCPYTEECKRGKGNRQLKVNEELERLREQAWDNLHTGKGIQYRKQRGIDVEPAFGDIKKNFGYRRFHLRGTEKVEIEFGLLSIAHNIKKIQKMERIAANLAIKNYIFKPFFVFIALLKRFYLIFALNYVLKFIFLKKTKRIILL